jgi:tetratricopeptide (TPR) repeat protein
LHADQSENVEFRKELLSKYRELNIELNPILHSLILGEAVRVEKAWPERFMFTEFIEWWGLDNLTDDDWEQFKTNDGKKLMSRVEKMIYLYTKEVVAISNLTPSDKFMMVLDKAITKWSKDDNIMRCKALILTKQSDNEGAIEIYKKIIKLTSGQKYYIWSDLATLVSDIDLKIGLLSKALTLRVQEEYLGKVRTQLAQLLYDKHLYANALCEVRKIEKTYQSNGWDVPSNIRQIAQNIQSTTQSVDNATRYPVWAQKADEFIYYDAQSTYMVKVAHREDYVTQANGKNKKVVKWTLVDAKGESVTVKPEKLNLYRADIGTCFEVKRDDKQVIYMSAIDNNNVTWRKSVKGTISIRNNKEGKPFGFVDDCYVAGHFLKQVKDGDNVAGVAICTNDKWRCIYIRKQ